MYKSPTCILCVRARVSAYLRAIEVGTVHVPCLQALKLMHSRQLEYNSCASVRPCMCVRVYVCARVRVCVHPVEAVGLERACLRLRHRQHLQRVEDDIQQSLWTTVRDRQKDGKICHKHVFLSISVCL